MIPTRDIGPENIWRGLKILGIGLVVVYVYLNKIKSDRAKGILPVSKIRSAAVGPIHLVGQLIAIVYSDNVYGLSKKTGSLVIYKIKTRRVFKINLISYIHSPLTNLFIRDETGQVKVELDPLPFSRAFTLEFNPSFKLGTLSRKNIPDSFFEGLGFKTHFKFLGIKIPKLYSICEYVLERDLSIGVFGYALPQQGGNLLVSSNPVDHQIVSFERLGRKKIPLRSFAFLMLGSVMVGVGLIVSIFSLGAIYSVSLLTFFIILFMILVFTALKYYYKVI